MRGPVCTGFGIISDSHSPYLKSKLNIPHCIISCTCSQHKHSTEELMFAGLHSVDHYLMIAKSGKCYPHFPPSLTYRMHLLESLIHRGSTLHAKKSDVFQSLIRAQHYRDDDLILIISPCKLIAVKHLALWRARMTFWMTSWTLRLPNETWICEFMRHAVIIKVLNQFYQFHGRESCIKFKVTVCTHRQLCHFLHLTLL